MTGLYVLLPVIWAASWVIAIVRAGTCDPDRTSLLRIVWPPIAISAAMMVWVVLG